MKLPYLLVIYLKGASWLWGATDNASRLFVCENFVIDEWNTWNGNPALNWFSTHSFRLLFNLEVIYSNRYYLRGFEGLQIMSENFSRAKISSTTSEIHGMEIWPWYRFPVMPGITRSHTLLKQISHATSRSQYFNENFYCKKCLRMFLSMTGKPAARSLIAIAKNDKYSLYHDASLLKAWFPFTPFTYLLMLFIVREKYISRKINFYFSEF